MPVNNFIVSSLPAYVEENRDLLLKNFGLVGGSIRNRIGIQTGVKFKEHLNYLEVAPALQDGSVCEVEPQVDGTQVTSTAATLLGKLQDLYAGMDDYTLNRGGEIYVSPANYRAFLMELVNANLYHYPSAENGTFPKEFFLPGTDVKVVMTEGLTGVDTIALASFPDNLRYGCDMQNDQEDIAVKYDPIKELFYIKALWNSGVQVAFPNKAFYMSL